MSKRELANLCSNLDGRKWETEPPTPPCPKKKLLRIDLTEEPKKKKRKYKPAYRTTHRGPFPRKPGHPKLTGEEIEAMDQKEYEEKMAAHRKEMAEIMTFRPRRRAETDAQWEAAISAEARRRGAAHKARWDKEDEEGVLARISPKKKLLRSEDSLTLEQIEVLSNPPGAARTRVYPHHHHTEFYPDEVLEYGSAPFIPPHVKQFTVANPNMEEVD